jgi:hypothetical protein
MCWLIYSGTKITSGKYYALLWFHETEQFASVSFNPGCAAKPLPQRATAEYFGVLASSKTEEDFKSIIREAHSDRFEDHQPSRASNRIRKAPQAVSDSDDPGDDAHARNDILALYNAYTMIRKQNANAQKKLKDVKSTLEATEEANGKLQDDLNHMKKKASETKRKRSSSKCSQCSKYKKENDALKKENDALKKQKHENVPISLERMLCFSTEMQDRANAANQEMAKIVANGFVEISKSTNK